MSFLRHLISFYGDSLQGLVPSYLEQSMQSFATNQEKMRDYMKETMGGLNPFGSFEEMNKQNMVMFENAMRMFAPQFYKEGENKETDASPKTVEKPSQSTGKTGDDLEKMKAQLEAMQQQLSKLSEK